MGGFPSTVAMSLMNADLRLCADHCLVSLMRSDDTFSLEHIVLVVGSLIRIEMQSVVVGYSDDREMSGRTETLICMGWIGKDYSVCQRSSPKPCPWPAMGASNRKQSHQVTIVRTTGGLNGKS